MLCAYLYVVASSALYQLLDNCVVDGFGCLDPLLILDGIALYLEWREVVEAI